MSIEYIKGLLLSQPNFLTALLRVSNKLSKCAVKTEGQELSYLYFKSRFKASLRGFELNHQVSPLATNSHAVVSRKVQTL